MTVLETLMTRFRRTGALLIIGFLLIIYIALGFLYLQQDSQQKELEKQIVQVGLIATRPLPSDAKLRQEHAAVNEALLPIAPSDAIATIVDIAEASGINVVPDSGKLSVSPISMRDARVGESNFQVLSFGSIMVQGDYEIVMAFISDLDSGEVLENMVLRSVTISQAEVSSENVTITTATLNVDIYTKGKK